MLYLHFFVKCYFKLRHNLIFQYVNACSNVVYCVTFHLRRNLQRRKVKRKSEVERKYLRYQNKG